ncbi:hypothetical protein ABES35_16805 [Bacillus subtilis]|uniref:hypothetical protein n=1 Tax=Bacillus subtilis TaxID=1423 RepID=UPI000FFE178B|nr:hypothetical protein [Bacillus subtilis]MEC2403325.1 hypothetical protein [Bacillus subtilis]MED4659424.1 hypothetical protein [Bacillus subtilis]MED4663729.1 hypothetical protein [Bacillus subtilis]NCT24000.1 hypothetical protein [Bacillus subtilis subsp. subtilis]QAT57954.1 hypothetical protein EQW70_11410 [Bacillus subtilis]
MGLYVTHGAFDGAYSSFNNLRRFLLKSIGGSWPPHDNQKFKDGYWYFGKDYSTKTRKGLTEFFGHSDCDGVITPEMCRVVAEELEAILPYAEELANKEMPHEYMQPNRYIEKAKQFINGSKLAFELNEPLQFR